MLKKTLISILESLGFVFFTPVAWVGGAMVILLTAANPMATVGALTCLVVTQLAGALLRLSPDARYSPAAIFNPFLLGAWVVYTGAPFTLIPFVGLTALLLERGFNRLMSQPLTLPVLSLPFTLVGWMVSAMTPSGITMVGLSSPTDILSSLGCLSLIPTPLAGGILLFTILTFTRINALLIVLGWAAGTGTGLLLTESVIPFNAILTALALGSGFLLPGWRSLLIAIPAAMLTVPIDLAFTRLTGLPALTLPFCLVTLGVLLLLRESALVPDMISNNALPEQRLLNTTLSRLQEVDRLPILLALPFAGTWTVTQGIDGPWTHQGHYRWAFDFVVSGEKEEQKTAVTLGDFHCWQAPILAPCEGRVVRVVRDLPDNPLNQPDKVNNWGNLIILQHEAGWFAELSHFAEESITVREGQRVEAGQLLGRCGNSGYSYQPHLHLQVQASPLIGAPTIPFAFKDVVLEDKALKRFALPAMGDRLATQPRRVEPGLSWETWVPATTYHRSNLLQTALRPLREIASLFFPTILVLRESYRQVNSRMVLCKIETSGGRKVASRQIELDSTSATKSSTGVFGPTLQDQPRQEAMNSPSA